MRVLVVNAGSSSLKHALVDSERIAAEQGGAVLASGEERWDPGDSPGRHGKALTRALRDAGGSGPAGPEAVGHRVVHGGERFEAPAAIDGDVRAGIEEAARLAPLHNRAALEGVDAALEAFPDLPQVACFDTAFHRTLDPEAATYAVPRDWREQHGIRRFGFHGLNVAWCAGRARELLGEEGSQRLVVCHLGSGCSATAVRAGRSCDTTMGFTPLDGVPMGTRSGAIDPGILPHLMRTAGLGADQLDDALNHRSGLLGLAGSADLRAMLAAARGGGGDDDDGNHGDGSHGAGKDRVVGIDDRERDDARLALSVFARGVAGAVAALTTSLGGLDALVFTAGIGERSPEMRARIAARLEHLGVTLDAARNAATTGGGADGEIGAAGARVRVLVLAAREELMVARETAAVLG